MENKDVKKQYPLTPEIAEAQPKEVKAKAFLKALLMHNLLTPKAQDKKKE